MLRALGSVALNDAHNWSCEWLIFYLRGVVDLLFDVLYMQTGCVSCWAVWPSTKHTTGHVTRSSWLWLW
jgi:hypothetical protein